MAEQFTKGGQQGWYHDQGHWGGFFHTYDQLYLGGILDQPRKIHVFLPRNYEVSEESYPVIYMNDGDTAFFPGGAFVKTWNMAGMLTRLYLSNQIRKVIVVAICPLNRDYEYTHAPVWGKQWGGLDDYANYLAFFVKGFIDANYRTIPDAEKTLILGSSHGGLAAFYTATQYPDQLRNVAALSPSFWVGLDSAIELSLLNFSGPFFGSLESSTLLYIATKTLENPNKHPKIYLDWGLVRTGGFHNFFIEERATTRGREMRDILIKKFGYQLNKNLFIVEDAKGEHTEESWINRLENILKLFFGF